VVTGAARSIGLAEEAEGARGRLCGIDDVVSFVKFLTIDGDSCTGQALNVTGGRGMHERR